MVTKIWKSWKESYEQLFQSLSQPLHLCQRLTSDRFRPRTQLCWKMGHWAAFVAVRPNVYPISLPSTSWDPIFQRVAYCNSSIMSDTKHVAESSSKFYVLKTVGKQGWKLKTLIIYDHLIHRSVKMTWFALICHCMASYCCGSEERWFGVATFGVWNPQLGCILERSGFNGRNLGEVMWMIYIYIICLWSCMNIFFFLTLLGHDRFEATMHLNSSGHRAPLMWCMNMYIYIYTVCILRVFVFELLDPSASKLELS